MSDNVVPLKGKALEESFLIPVEGDKDVGKQVFACFAEVIEDRKATGRHKRMLRNYEMIRNKHWKREPSVKVPLATANFCFTHHQRTVNMLTDNNPTFNVAKLPNNQTDPEVADKCEMLQHATDHWWVEQEQQDVFDTSVRNGETYGVAIEKVMFDLDAGEFGVGEVRTISIDPFQFGVYPTRLANPKDIEQSYIIFYFYPMTVTDARQRWPKQARNIKADYEALKDIGDERKKVASGGQEKDEGYMSRMAGAVKEVINFISPSVEEREQVLIIEAWVHDRTEEKNTDGSKQPKYTGEIRYISVCNGGKVVLEDRDNPNINENLPSEAARLTYLFNRRPFSMVNSVRDTASCWGFSDLEQIEQLQMEVDKAISQFILFKDRASRRKIKNPLTSGVDNGAFTNTLGVIRPSNAMESQGIDYMREPDIPVDIVKSIEIFKDLMLFIAGTFDIDQAMAKGNNRLAYKALQSLLERASTMQRGKVRSYSRLIRERGRMYISCLQNFYTDERLISFIDKDGTKVAKGITGTSLILPAKLTVVDGSTMPTSRVQQREEAIALRQMGVYDDEALLRFLDTPGWQEILKRKKEGMLQPIMRRLQQLGVPAPILQYLGAVATVDDKKFAQAVKEGQIPPFPVLMQKIMQQMQGKPDPQQQAMQQEQQLEAAESQARIGKMEAEKMLIVEKITTERVIQQEKILGAKHSEDNIQTERVRVAAQLHEIEMQTIAKMHDIAAKREQSKNQLEVQREAIKHQAKSKKE